MAPDINIVIKAIENGWLVSQYRVVSRTWSAPDEVTAQLYAGRLMEGLDPLCLCANGSSTR